jgi:hypothetical protein
MWSGVVEEGEDRRAAELVLDKGFVMTDVLSEGEWKMPRFGIAFRGWSQDVYLHAELDEH